MKPADIRKGCSYTNGAGAYRKVVVFSPANPSKRGRAVDMVGWKTSGDGAIQWSGLAGFAGWAERECGGTPVELGEESPRPAGKEGHNRPRRPGRRRKPRGLASAIREAVLGLREEGLPARELAVFATGMFAARYGWVTAVRSAWRVRKIFEALP